MMRVVFMEKKHMAKKMSGWAAAVVLVMQSCTATPERGLSEGFENPPGKAQPHTWWHWMNGNVTKEGITADLEAMKEIGLGGAQMFNVSEGIPDGPVLYMSAEWREMMKHAQAEAERLGLELCVHNCAGWSSSGGPWIAPEHAMQIVTTSEVRVSGPGKVDVELPEGAKRLEYYRDIAVLAFPTPREDARVPDIGAKAGFEARYNQQPDLREYGAGATIARGSIVDVTGWMEGGRLRWDVPAGEWTVLRIGYTPTGAVNAPAPESGRGLEVDKFSREALDAHWDGMMGPVLADLGRGGGSGLNNALIDSYEVGAQNWTAKFREEFTARRGYDPLVMLPALTGRVVESGEITERFLWDMRRTIADLFADNYYTYFAEKCRENGLLASIEPYDGPFECLLTGRDADIPMGEFWVGGGETVSVRLAASVGHTYGQRLIGAEAFTAAPNAGKWLNHPGNLKAIGDLIYCQGINRFIIHRYAHQPWLDQYPGMTMGQWGTHFERTTTWWEQGKAWIDYLARCQFMLQQGRFAADALLFAGDAAPNSAPYEPELKAAGYDYDACNADVLLRHASVRDGRIVLASGMTYRVLVLPESRFMRPETLAKVGELVRAGATVMGPKPEKSPSLTGYPECDAQVKRWADELWGSGERTSAGERRVGAGRVIWGRTAREALEEMVRPDASFAAGGPGAAPAIAWIHRTVGDAEVYFISNQKPRSEEVVCRLRVEGKKPELFHPDSGVIEDAPVWAAEEGATAVSLAMGPSDSVFVVFRKDADGAAHMTSVRAPEWDGTTPKAPQITIRKAMYEAIDGAGGADVTAKVAAMAAKGQWSIGASNSLFGDPAYNHVKRLRVEFTVDGKSKTLSADENATLDLVPPAPDTPARYRLRALENGTTELAAFAPGVYEFATSAGEAVRKEIASLPEPIEPAEPWTVTFPTGWGAPASITLAKLISWPEHEDPGVRYFSGTATYTTTFDLPAEYVDANRTLTLDLGRVAVIAEVRLNGKDLGTWWKGPFTGDITGAAHAGRNTLEVRVTNLWPNRLIGDEQLPEDVEWRGITLARWPEWLTSGQMRKSGRRTFTTWHHYTKDSALLESGLIGPVLVRAGERVVIE